MPWPVIRLAVAEDRDTFLGLAEKFLTELVDVGSEIVVTPRTMEVCERLFEAYVEDRAMGVIVMAGDVGFSAAGAPEDDAGMELRFGPVAYDFGTFVLPEYRLCGLASALQEITKDELTEMGFGAILAGVHVGNPAGLASAEKAGFIPFQIVGYVPLSRDDDAAKDGG